MPILAIPDSGSFFEQRHALSFNRWPIGPKRPGTWEVSLTVGSEVLRAVFGQDIFTRPCSSYWVPDDFGNLVKVS
jgi:hypothetical protein